MFNKAAICKLCATTYRGDMSELDNLGRARWLRPVGTQERGSTNDTKSEILRPPHVQSGVDAGYVVGETWAASRGHDIPRRGTSARQLERARIVTRTRCHVAQNVESHKKPVAMLDHAHGCSCRPAEELVRREGKGHRHPRTRKVVCRLRIRPAQSRYAGPRVPCADHLQAP